MNPRNDNAIPRRELVRALAATAAFYTVPGLFAEELALTPRQTEGPFYPDKMPLDMDNDLLVINNNATPAMGEVAHVTGRVLTPSGAPVRNAVVEIWQVDANGVYLHSRAPNQEKRDTNFQGFGRFETGSTGEYRFRTIKPVWYSTGARLAPHIHYAINRNGHRLLTTQLYIKGHAGNENDSVVRGSSRGRGSGQGGRQVSNPLDFLAVEFNPVPGSKIGELAATFDIVVDA